MISARATPGRPAARGNADGRADPDMRPRPLLLPGTVLDLLGAESTPQPGTSSRSSACYGGGWRGPSAGPAGRAHPGFSCCGARSKLGAFLPVSVGVLRDLFYWVAMAVACGPADGCPRHGARRRSCAAGVTSGPRWRHEALPGAGRRRDAGGLADRRGAGADRARPQVRPRRRHLRRHYDDGLLLSGLDPAEMGRGGPTSTCRTSARRCRCATICAGRGRCRVSAMPTAS